MTHFTQLGLSGKPETKTTPSPAEQRPQSNPNQLGGKRRTATLIGSLLATSLLGIFVIESGCSKESGKTATITPPAAAMATQQLPPVVPAAAVATQPLAKKKSRQRKLSASTYTNPTYGVSFRYPKYGTLKQGDQANLELAGLGPVEMNFVQPGGTTISAVEIPRSLYAGTDFNSAFFNLSVNPKITADECGRFAFPEPGDPGTDPAAISKTKVGVTEFHSVEGFATAETNQADVKYYHVFQNGSCYEFALGLETAADSTIEKGEPASRPVDRNEVFRKLNWMLSTVKIQPVDLPGTAVPELAAGSPTAAEPANR